MIVNRINQLKFNTMANRLHNNIKHSCQSVLSITVSGRICQYCDSSNAYTDSSLPVHRGLKNFNSVELAGFGYSNGAGNQPLFDFARVAVPTIKFSAMTPFTKNNPHKPVMVSYTPNEGLIARGHLDPSVINALRLMSLLHGEAVQYLMPR